MAASAVAGAALPVALSKTPQEAPRVTPPLEIETQKATYLPFYERHDRRITLEQIKAAGVLNLHFYENMLPSNVGLASSAWDVLHSNSRVYGEEELDRTTPDEILEYFSQNDISVAYEFIDLPAREHFFSKAMTSLEVGATTSLSLATLAKTISDIAEGKKMSSSTFVANSALVGSILWGIAPLITTSTNFFSIENEDLERGLSPQRARILRSINSLLTHAHPEDLRLLFRNILMARKLQLLAENVSGTNEGKPRIGYQVGSAHTGIEDFLALGPNLTIAALSIFPKPLIKKIVDFNGGIDAFCSTGILSVKKVLTNQENPQTVILDTKLKEYLEARFKEEPN